MPYTEYIVEILEYFEGKGLKKGYVPAVKGKALGSSGVTIGTGFDLGQQTLEGLMRLDLPPHLLNKLAPYVGAKCEAAQYLLARSPLFLTDEEVAELDAAVHDRYIRETAALFGPEAFEAAPKEVQAVATSLHYQFGTPYRAASPALGKAWEALKAGDYASAAQQLRRPGGWSLNHQRYMGRREQEAALLELLAVGV